MMKFATDAEQLYKVIQTVAYDAAAFSDPSQLLFLPFPYPPAAALVPKRFELVDGHFNYLGRAEFDRVNDVIANPPSAMVNIYGTKGKGKSHMIAASVVLQLKQGNHIVFIPQARDFALAPFKSLMCALLLAFAADKPAVSELVRIPINNMYALLGWTAKRNFTLVVDQINALEKDSKVTSELISDARGFLSRIAFSCRIVYGYGYSANNETAKEMRKEKQRSDSYVRLFGGLSVPVIPFSLFSLFLL